MSMSRPCAICGSQHYTDRKVLWADLIRQWELSPEEVEYIDRQQGRDCATCHSSWRSISLAAAVMAEFQFEGLFNDFVTSTVGQSLRVLEVNGAGTLSEWLAKIPRYCRVDYPEVDLQQLPFSDASFDLVIHSDTLEHIPDPARALKECQRVLADNGRCAFTVPLIVGRLTRSRQHLKASYHGNPSNPADMRVHTEFGADAWCHVLRAGFDRCQIHGWDYPAAMTIVGVVEQQTTPHAPRTPASPTTVPTHEPNVASPAPRETPAHARPASGVTPTGERLLPSMTGRIVVEHLHRYALAQAWAQGRDVLDIACGEGYGSHLLAQVARQVTGVDVDESIVLHARQRYPRPNLQYLVGDCRSIPLPGESIDLAISFETIEHLREQPEFLRELRRVLRPEGILLISTPDPAVYSAGQPANPYHLRELTRHEFLALLQTEFQQVEWSIQRTLAGSLIVPQEPAACTDQLHSTAGDFSGFRSERALTNGEYIIAAATNHPHKMAWHWGVYEHPTYGDKSSLDSYAQLVALRNSLSWKITQPLRWLADAVTSLVGPRR